MIVWPTQKFKVMQRCTKVKREQQWQEILIIRICYIAAIIQWSIFGESDHSDPIQSEINVSILTPQMTFYRIPRHFWSILCPSDGVDTGRMAWVSLRRSRVPGDGWGWSISEDSGWHTQSLRINGPFACRVYGILGGLEFYFVASLECSCKQLVLMQGLAQWVLSALGQRCVSKLRRRVIIG